MTELMNMQDIKTQISEQIKVSLFNLLPEDKLVELVENELNAYFSEPVTEFWAVTETYDYSKPKLSGIAAKVSPFRLLVWTEINAQLKDSISAILESPEFYARCTLGDEASEAITRSAMSRQEAIALSMVTRAFDSVISETIRLSATDTNHSIRMSVFAALDELKR